MSLFDATPQRTVWRDRCALVLQAASLALTGWVLWGARLAAGWPHLSLSSLIVRSAVYAVGAWTAGAAITLVLYLGAMQWEREDVLRATLRTSSAAVWFAPSVILLTQLSPAALAAATVLVVHATRALYHEWRVHNPPLPPMAHSRGLFASVELPRPDFWRDVAPALAISFSAQLGVAAMLLRRHVLAGLAFAMSVSLGTVFALTSRAMRRKPAESLPRTAFGVLLTIVLAIGLTVAGMLPGWAREFGDGSGIGMGTGAGADPAKASPSGGGAGPPELPRATDATFADGGFPGVILWPEVKPYATLIAPMPQTPNGLATVETRPMSIPFSGEYWMFRWPFARPPRTSLFQRGTPAKLSFKTTDHRPLQMEARHKFDQPIALSCCGKIRMEIRNADRYPNTIELELVLIDNDLPGAPWLSLGREVITSIPDLSKDPVPPVGETLEFTVPTGARIDAFDELRIVFYRDRRRMDQSAKVSIERFVLVPRL